MADYIKPRVKVPTGAKPGEIIEIKTLISHPMESGQRKDTNGKIIPRKIINSFVCTLDGKQVFRAELEPAISANPYLSFCLRAERSGTLAFAWTDDDGTVYKTEEKLTLA
ncbi:MAG TPA: thiosulfate oxidation carrier complex protein SoxZ [Candidatus Sulfotelmatobacter sp.]|nr:thiosulfate oxidation carrier complex protein SoxZ [Candidatus Sulfotelmatobacter sp.]